VQFSSLPHSTYLVSRNLPLLVEISFDEYQSGGALPHASGRCELKGGMKHHPRLHPLELMNVQVPVPRYSLHRV
jgi:hypothetical protein